MRCVMDWCNFDFTFDLGSACMFSNAILETYFSYYKDITDYYMYVHLIVLYPLIVILQLINLLGALVRGCRFATSWCNFDLTLS